MEAYEPIPLHDPTDDHHLVPDETGDLARWRVAVFYEHHPNEMCSYFWLDDGSKRDEDAIKARVAELAASKA